MRLLALPLLLAASAIPLVAREDAPTPTWTHFRGPGMQGHSSDTKVPLSWGEKNNLLWKLDLPGDGHSSPIVWGDRIFLTGATNGGKEVHVFCVSTAGKLLWKDTPSTEGRKEQLHAWQGHASPSCATDGKYVYAFFGSPGVFCYDVDGKQVWKKNFGTFLSKANWGTAASPILYGDTVIVNCDNDGKGSAPAALVALDKKTGDVKWSTPRNQGRGFGTPLLMKTAGGRLDLVLNGPDGLFGYDPKTGKELWRSVRSNPDDLHKFGEPMPVDDGERIFVQSGRTGPYQLLKMPGSGDVTKTHVLHQAIRGRRDVASPVLVDGRVYCLDKAANLTVFSMKTGEEITTVPLARRGASSMASPVYVRGKVLWVLDDGTTVVVEPGDKPKVVARNKLPGGKLDYGASPAVVDGRLYIRSRTTLYCIGEKK